MKYYELKACTSKCRSCQHANDLIGLLSRTSQGQVLLSGLLQCYNCHKVQDTLGRYLIHVAASYGRTEVCDWLVKYKKAEVNVKSAESGWTPAHCAVFYGHIDSLVALIRSGANLTKLDHDRLTPIENLTLDKWLSVRFEPNICEDEYDVYSWGSNVNFNLANVEQKVNAEIVEFFKKTNTFIVQIAMSKFHSVFLAKNGQVYTCGFGLDGRLGHETEATLVVPKLVDKLKDTKIVQIAASRNNTYLVSSDGNIYSCGSNEFKQLGQVGVQKALTPKKIGLPKRLKGKSIRQVECSRFHCVILTSSNELYTFGLNAGQLGHPNEMTASASSSTYNSTICYIVEPRLVTSLTDADMEISLIACSDGCTVCLQSSKNILHIFSEYKSRRLYYVKEVGGQFVKIRVRGGRLDHCTNTELKWIEDFGDPICIVGLTDKNLLFMWKETDPVWRNLTWSVNKHLKVVDFDLNKHGLIIATKHGNCYRAEFKSQKTSPTSSSSTSELKTETLELIRVPFVNRCAKVTCDIKGRNYFVLQHQPTANMRLHPEKTKSQFRSNMRRFIDEEENLETNLHFNPIPGTSDLVVTFKDASFNLHKFILLSRCWKLFGKFESFKNQTEFDLTPHLDGKLTTDTLNMLIKLIYVSQVEIDDVTETFRRSRINTETNYVKFLQLFRETVLDKLGLVEFKQPLDQSLSSNALNALKQFKLDSKGVDERLPLIGQHFLNLLNLAAVARSKTIYFNRLSHDDLYDCQIDCNDGQWIKCHKCVLVARSEFFRNMFLGGWLESSLKSVSLPFDLDLAQIFVDYLYTDELILSNSGAKNESTMKSRTEIEIELLVNLYVLSDQLLVERLKNLCEFRLAYLINLKNVIEMFDFSCEYEATQLKDYCMEFISRNLDTLVEMRQLESLGMSSLQQLAKFYRGYFPLIEARLLTPYSFGLDPDKVELVPEELLYDEKFIQGVGPGEEAASRKKTSTPLVGSKLKPLEDELKIMDNLSLGENSVDHDPGHVSASQQASGPVNTQKWETVTKKNRRKISENNNEKSLETNAIQSEQRLSFNESPVTNIVNEPNKPTKPNLPEAQVKPQTKPQNGGLVREYSKIEWPDLANSAPKQDERTKQQKQLPAPKMAPKKPTVTKVENGISQMKTPTAGVWGGVTVSQQSSNFSLKDVINEELKKSTKKDSPQSQYPSNNKNNPTPKSATGVKSWNLTSLNNEATSQVNSFAQILEQETKSEKHYNKLKNRPLHVIQLEEKAIEDLKKLYAVDDMTDMLITIELVDEATYIAPLWKKS